VESSFEEEDCEFSQSVSFFFCAVTVHCAVSVRPQLQDDPLLLHDESLLLHDERLMLHDELLLVLQPLFVLGVGRGHTRDRSPQSFQFSLCRGGITSVIIVVAGQRVHVPQTGSVGHNGLLLR